MKTNYSKSIKALFAFAALSSIILAQTITVRADYWMPFCGEPVGNETGLMVEVLKEIYTPEKITVDYKTMPWTRAVKDAEAGVIDAVIGAYIDDAPGFVFPKTPFMETSDSFFVLEGNTWKYTGVASLKNLNFGCIQDYFYAADIDAYISSGKGNPKIQVASGETAVEMNLKKLQAKRLDVVIENAAVFMWKWNEIKSPIKAVNAGKASADKGLYIAFSPKKPSSKKYADIFDAGIAKMKTSGSLAKIKTKYKL